MAEERPAFRMHVHERDDLRVDGILRLIEAASVPGPLSKVLQNMCRHAATIAHADVVSAYVREQTDEGDFLVLRANVGFPDSAIGQVRLALGEGITGTAAEVMRPISAQVAQEDTHYKHFDGLGEERFPSLLAIPLMVRGAVAGVLVLQRGEAAAFADTEVALGTALATTFALALERREDASRTPSRSARLTGQGVAPGTALGRAIMLGTLEALRPGVGSGSGDPSKDLTTAFDATATLLRKAQRRVQTGLTPAALGALESLLLMLEDQRLRATAIERCTKLGIAPGLKQVAREYAVATYAAGVADPMLEQRAIEIENLCLLVATTASGLPLPSPGEVLVVAERLPAMAALALVGRAAAVVASGTLSDDGLGVIVARAAAVPVLASVEGLFAWVRPEDTLLVDAAQGILRVNPPATTIARYRHMRESNRPDGAAAVGSGGGGGTGSGR